MMDSASQHGRSGGGLNTPTLCQPIGTVSRSSRVRIYPVGHTGVSPLSPLVSLPQLRQSTERHLSKQQ